MNNSKTFGYIEIRPEPDDQRDIKIDRVRISVDDIKEVCGYKINDIEYVSIVTTNNIWHVRYNYEHFVTALCEQKTLVFTEDI